MKQFRYLVLFNTAIRVEILDEVWDSSGNHISLDVETSLSFFQYAALAAQTRFHFP